MTYDYGTVSPVLQHIQIQLHTHNKHKEYKPYLTQQVDIHKRRYRKQKLGNLRKI